GEVEFVSLDGELKECVLWAGPLCQVARRATLLPGEHTLSTDTPVAWPPVGQPRAWLYDPDPAVVRAGLVGELARRLDAHPLDPHIGCLTGDVRHDTPFARVYAIEAALPYHLRRLQDYLRQHHVGRVQVRRRGSAIDPAELERKLKLSGEDFRTLLLTQ